MAISNAVPQSAVARVLGIEEIYSPLNGAQGRFLPIRIAVIGQGSSAVTYASTKKQVTSALAVGNEYGFGSPLYNAVAQLLPQNGDGVGTLPVTVYPLQDGGGATASSGEIAVAGAAQNNTATYYVSFNGVLSAPITIPAAAIPAEAAALIGAAVNAVSAVPSIASVLSADVTLASKWAGASANDINIEIVGTEDGLTFGVTQPAGGATNPDVQDALNQVGNVWDALIVNCLDKADTVALGKFQTFGEGRWGALTHKPCLVFSGETSATVADATAIPEARKTDRVNVQIVEPAGVDLPHVIAARGVARIAKVANDNPARDYGGQACTGLTPGADGSQWDYLAQNEAVTKGSSTINVVDGVVRLADTVTFYHPSGDPLPAYRFVVDVIKLMNAVYNINLALSDPSLDGAPLIPDDEPTVNPDAKKPRDLKAIIWSVLDFLGQNAMISDSKGSKDATQVVISATNPKRVDYLIPFALGGNVNVQSATIQWGFYFGSPITV